MSVPPGVIEQIAIGIAASGVVEVGSLGASVVANRIRDGLAGEARAQIGETFASTLRTRIEAVDASRETNELADVTEDWDAIVEHLAAADLPVMSTDAAVEHILDAIAAEHVDPSVDSDLERAMREAVEEAYADALDKFAEEIHGTELEETLQIEIDREIRDALADLADEIRPRKAYRMHAASGAGRVAEDVLDAGGASPDVEFVERAIDRPDARKVLITGPGGAGKTHLLGEWLQACAAEDGVGHVVTPRGESHKKALNTERDLEPLVAEPFDGDAVLVWDDARTSGPEEDRTIFEKAIAKLDDVLAEQGHDLHVLATARSNRVDPSVERNRAPTIWREFSVARLSWLESEDRVRSVLDNMLEAYEVELAEDTAVREAIVERTLAADPSPEYIRAVLTASEGPLTVADVQEMPDKVLELWEEAIDELRRSEETRAQWEVLLAARILDAVGVSAYTDLVVAVAQFLFDRDRMAHPEAIDALADRRGWIGTSDLNDSDSVIHVHDVRLEAVACPTGMDFRDLVKEVVEAVLHGDIAVDGSIPDQVEIAEVIGQIGTSLARDFGEHYGDLAEKCLEAAIDQREGDFPEAHYNYALLLKDRLDRTEDAEDHYQTAIQLQDGDDPEAHYNYALLLEDRLDRPEDAEDHYQTAIRLQDGDDPEAHFNYALLLRNRLDRPEEARTHVEQSIEKWRARDRLDNAIHDSPLLFRICADMDDYDAALEAAADAVALCVRADDDRRERFVEAICEATDEAPPAALVRSAYRAAMECLSDKHGPDAHRLFAVAYRQRDAVEGELRRRAHSAGVGVVALLDVVDDPLRDDPLADLAHSDREALVAALCEHGESLRPPVAGCLTLLSGEAFEGTETPDVDDSLRSLETQAFGRLSALAV